MALLLVGDSTRQVAAGTVGVATIVVGRSIVRLELMALIVVREAPGRSPLALLAMPRL